MPKGFPREASAPKGGDAARTPQHPSPQWDAHRSPGIPPPQVPGVPAARLTLAVHAKGVQQAGAAELGAQEGHVQLHEPRLAVLCRQLQLAAAHPPARQSLGVPTTPRRLGQEAVHEVELRFLDAVDEGVLQA